MPNAALEKIAEKLDGRQVITSGDLLEQRRQDWWNASNIRNLSTNPVPCPAGVVQPKTLEDVQNIVRIASEFKTPIVPYGLGSGVCGGIQTQGNEILLDMSKMNRVRQIDEANMLAWFDAGKRGIEAEQDVAQKGFTIGHWPQSIDLSSVGGWVATRASGQYSTAYGNIEDIVYAIEAVLPNGEVIVAGKSPRASSGPDLKHLLLGSEGTLAVITGVAFSMRKAATSKLGSIFLAKDMDEAFEAQRQLIQAGWRPPVIRQYDVSESARHFGDAIDEGGVVLLMVHEGDPDCIAIEKKRIAEIAKSSGLPIGDDAIVEQWLEHRNKVPTFTELLEKDIVVDTIEVAAPWTKIGNVYRKVTEAMSQIPGLLAGTGHSSHAYRSGANLYFTFAGRMSGVEEQSDFYFNVWDTVMQVTAAEGGGIAHHHGIGRVRKNYLELDLGPEGISALRAVKTALDPHNIMNPGVLLPDV